MVHAQATVRTRTLRAVSRARRAVQCKGSLELCVVATRLLPALTTAMADGARPPRLRFSPCESRGRCAAARSRCRAQPSMTPDTPSQIFAAAGIHKYIVVALITPLDDMRNNITTTTSTHLNNLQDMRTEGNQIPDSQRATRTNTTSKANKGGPTAFRTPRTDSEQGHRAP